MKAVPDPLDRFRLAQNGREAGFASALNEIRTGRKTGHWIWYVFPQLAGLGQSDMARHYAIDGPEEAAAYLRDPGLRSRLLAMTTAVARQLTAGRPVPLRRLMGSDVDARKLVSSLTLFGRVAGTLDRVEPHEDYRALASAATAVLHAAESEGYPACRFTLEQLARVSE